MLYLIRHPRPDVAEGLCYGQMDVPVSKSELNDAVTTLTPLLAELSTCQVFSSPLQRCRSLADALAKQHHWPEPIVDDRLKEIHFGEWEGGPWNDIPRHQIDAWAADVEGYTPPGGEAVLELKARVQSWLVDIASFPHPLVVITHAGVIRGLTGCVRQLPVSEWSVLTIDYASLTVLPVEGKIIAHV